MSAGGTASATTSPADPRQVVKALEAQLARTPKGARPYEHATLAYRLGLAYAESPGGTPGEGLRKALAYYDLAAAIFDPRYDPVEHGRVLNAAGAAHRALGDRRRAATLFEKAADLLTDRGRDDERAAALNNLGLVRSELGELDPAVEAFDVAADLFDLGSAEGRRGRVATLHNRGLARAGHNTEEGLEAALADYGQAAAELDPEDAPYHHALVQHSIGVACSALAALRPAERERLLGQAAEAFRESLQVFTSASFPFQHALAKHNLGLALAGLAGPDGVRDRRRALACFEDAVSVLDPRMHADAWRQAYASLERVEKELASLTGVTDRTSHFAALVASVDRNERLDLVQERYNRLLALPGAGRRSKLAELALASARLSEDQAMWVMEAELTILMELPPENLTAALSARWDAHQQLSGTAREQADLALDNAIGEALGGPQRIFVRDFLYSLGWERP